MLTGVEREAGEVARAQRVHHRNHAHEQGPLVDFVAHQGPEGGRGAVVEHEEHHEHHLGHLAGEGGHPLHQQKLVDAQGAAGRQQGFGEGLGGHDDDGHGHHGQPAHDKPLLAHGQGGQGSGGAHFVVVVLPFFGFVVVGFGQAAQAPEVGGEDAGQHHEIDHPDGAFPDDDEGIEAGQGQVGDFGGVVPVQGHGALAAVPPVEQHYQRPARPDEQAVGSGHVGGGKAGVGRVRVQAGPIRVVEVDGVLGQHGDQGQYSDDQPLGDVLLGRFGPPREQEAGPEDGHEENAGFEHGGHVGAGQAQVEAGKRGQHREGDIKKEFAHERRMTENEGFPGLILPRCF